jgi:hypothetical protein
MVAQLVSFMTTAVAVHALLLSLGGLMVVNSLRALARVEEQIWEGKPDEERERYFGVFESPHEPKIGILQNEMPRLMKVNLVIGSFGVLYSLAAIAFFSQNPQAWALVVVSFMVVSSQIRIFVLITLRALEYLGWWIKKLPQRRR